jgi:hypothetical protein
MRLDQKEVHISKPRTTVKPQKKLKYSCEKSEQTVAAQSQKYVCNAAALTEL